MAFAAVLVLSLLTSDTGHCRHLLAYPVVVSAVAFLREMATFASAGVSERA